MERKKVAVIGLIFIIFIVFISVITNFKEDEEWQVIKQIEEQQTSRDDYHEKIFLEEIKEIEENKLISTIEKVETQLENNLNESFEINNNIQVEEENERENVQENNYLISPLTIIETNNDNNNQLNNNNNNNNNELNKELNDKNNELNEEKINEQANNDLTKDNAEISITNDENCLLNLALEEECKVASHHCLHEVGHKYAHSDPHHICETCLNATQENACVHGYVEEYFSLFPFLPSKDPKNSIENIPQSHSHSKSFDNHLLPLPSIKKPENLTEEELTKIAERVEKFCSVLPLDKQGDCYHGVGHPIYRQLDINFGEIVCSKLSKEFAYWNCIGGVYMIWQEEFKISIKSVSNMGKSLFDTNKENTAVSICSSRREIAQCIYYILFSLKTHNIHTVFQECHLIEDQRVKNGCYMYYGKNSRWWMNARDLKVYSFDIMKPIIDGGHLGWVHAIGLHERLTSYENVYCKSNLELDVREYCLEQLSLENHDYRKDLSIYSTNFP